MKLLLTGVTFSASKNDGIGEFEEIHLVPEPVFVLPTDGISMMCVKSTAEGRIFMGGKDGCLYEITYQVNENCQLCNPFSTSMTLFSCDCYAISNRIKISLLHIKDNYTNQCCLNDF